MPTTTADLLALVEEKSLKNIKQLAKEVEIPLEKLHAILISLSQHGLVEYDSKTGKVALPKWLLNINQKIEKEKTATGEIILPKYKEIQIQDILIGNYTGNDLELKVRLKADMKEIAICPIA